MFVHQIWGALYSTSGFLLTKQTWLGLDRWKYSSEAVRSSIKTSTSVVPQWAEPGRAASAPRGTSEMKSAWIIQTAIVSFLGLSAECGATERQGKNHTKKDHTKEDKETSQTNNNKIPNNILEAVLQLWALPWTQMQLQETWILVCFLSHGLASRPCN